MSNIITITEDGYLSISRDTFRRLLPVYAQQVLAKRDSDIVFELDRGDDIDLLDAKEIVRWINSLAR